MLYWSKSMAFRQNAEWCSALCADLRRWSFGVVRRSASITKWAVRISQVQFDLQSTLFTRTPVPTTLCRYNITSYFRSEFIAKQLSNVPPLMAWGRISPERFERVSRNFKHLSGTITISLKNLPDMSSLATSCRLHNAFKYCSTQLLKRVRREKSQIIRALFRIKESPNFTGISTPT